jgi:putative phosphoesterase
MRICVLADTHQNVPLALKAVSEMGQVDLVIHLGDCYIDIKEISARTGLPFKAVPGNKDWHSEIPDEAFWEFGGVKMMALHGHQYDLNAHDDRKLNENKYALIAARAIENGADMVLYGHNHRAEQFYVDGVHFFNPGEMTFGTIRCTYGIIEISGDTFKTQIKEIAP